MFQVITHIQVELLGKQFIFYLESNTQKNQCTRIGSYENAICSRQHLQRPKAQIYIYEFCYMDIDWQVYFSLDKI